ncbi:rhodanese domain containing protein [Grosmannia clavigera kw1407]|uniref:Rhodanese domain containing protein n=1 Tax=Grosmannia clavigera (strain kw1407 / UAMH 11150) TaxID=655863 RepID=F0X8X9_GROCL|nr:rhodanese domain containing protein [Grosmannia clavigera kw1407]EFX05761.1 rhodanese domain containing protein [Grosmannia clavigera kw1407]
MSPFRYSLAAKAPLALLRASPPVPLKRAFAVRTIATTSSALVRANAVAKGSTQRSWVAVPLRRAYSSAPEAAGKTWSFEELQTATKKAGSTVILVDAREPGELAATGRIPGAINIPVTSSPDGFFLPDEEFEDRFGFERPARDAEIVFYCKAGVRSRAAATLARDAGWTNVAEYPGSWLDWTGKGGAVEH